MSLLRLWPAADTPISPGAMSGAPGAGYISSEGVAVSGYNPELVRDDPNFLFRLELSKLVQDTSPRPPNNFIDRLLKLLRVHSAHSHPVTFSRMHQLQGTFLTRLRCIMGKETLPVALDVVLKIRPL